ncbi:MAG: DUF1501 domain-containing protein [Planctomycetaceae bacterium]|jgi:hypothetical protein|nr:DUF1501 domain-containing protein [Planctomycetaceae bacterium]MBT6483241.1 DUF1501 domain-containing protein [Planctomycetaceae bacterium]MBT6492916.1 DUF1501 domain-containing protein [Planctomycetaceae bacterium]
MNGPASYCDGIKRRDLLRVGVAGMTGAALPLSQLLQSQAAADAKGEKNDVSLIILFLQGGLSTIDILDLKPNAPAEFRGEFNPIDTNVRGMQICEHLPQVAGQADKFSLLRNFTHTNSGHGPADHWMLTGYAPRPGFNGSLKPNNQRPAHGSIISRMLGPRGSVPPYVCLPKMHNSGGAAYLGTTAAPFVVNADPNAPGFSVPDLAPPLAIDSKRFGARRQLLGQIDRYKKAAEIEANRGAKALSTFQQKAFDLISSPETKAAFDITQESDKLRDEYGRSSLGQSCLMARRLVEAGVRCVTIDHTNWDTHYNNFHVLKNDLLPHLDAGLSTLLRDLSNRGRLQSTLLVVMSEFGRTPRVNKDAGRDHWGPSNCMLLAGGGIQGGRVVGATNSRGEKPAADPVGPADLAATMYRCLGIDPNFEFFTPEGRPVRIVDGGKVITDVL